MIGGMGGGNVVRVNPKPYSPIYDQSYLMMPRDRREINQWCRHFYATDPIIRNALDLHTRYPLSKFDIRCPYPKVKAFFDEMIDRINLHEVLLGIGLEYWKIGEVFPETELDESKGVWKNIYIHNPDYIDVRDAIFLQEPFITLIPDDETKRIIRNPSTQDDISIRNQLDEDTIKQVLAGQNIQLNPFNISYIVNKAAPYDKRGTSILECIFKDLMLRDKYREAQYVIADNHVTPLKVFKIGDGEIRPTGDDLEVFRNTLEEAVYDPNFTLVYHKGLEVEYVGSNGVILDLSGEFERIERMMFIGLFTSQTIASGDGPTFTGQEIGLDILQQRYMGLRQRMEHWLERKIFRPIAELQDFYEYDADSREKKLIVPRVVWHKMNLKTNKDYIDQLNGLAEAKKCSYKRLFDILDLDFEEELTTIADEQRMLRKLDNELKALDSEGAPEEAGSEEAPAGDDFGLGDLGGGTEEGGEAAPALPALGEAPEGAGGAAPEEAPPEEAPE